MSRMYYGTHRTLEAEADRLLRESLRGVTRHSEKSDILTPWKQNERRRREVYVPSGTPDSANRQGLFTRSLNQRQTHLNSRDGIARNVASINQFVDSHGGGSIYDSIIPDRF